MHNALERKSNNMPYKIPQKPNLDLAKKAVRELRYRQQRESKRMSIRIMKILSDVKGRGALSSVLYMSLWPDKIDNLTSNNISAMRAINFTMGRARNSFMGLLATGTKHGRGKGEMLWKITETGEYYLKIYEKTPQVVIDGERNSRTWLQDNGRRYMSEESIEKRVQEEVQVKKELRRMRMVSVADTHKNREQDIYATYDALIHPQSNYCYRVGRNNRRRPMAH